MLVKQVSAKSLRTLHFVYVLFTFAQPPLLGNLLANTLERLKQLIHEQHHLDMSAITLDTGLADIGLDSLAVAELLFSIEETMGVDLGDVAPEAVPATVGELVSLIDQHQPAS